MDRLSTDELAPQLALFSAWAKASESTVHNTGNGKSASNKKSNRLNDQSSAKKKYISKPVGDAPRRRRPPLDRSSSVAPKAGEENILVTSALPYVNNVPHLGNIIGSTLSADVYARWCRQRGKNVIYICGTDEYGTATETKALQEGLTPRGICDKFHEVHRQVYEWFDICFDYFGRTSCPDPANTPEWPQTQIAQQIFLDNLHNNNLIEQTTTQVFCTGCDRFLADRYVEGACPKCLYEDARGDQCDGCGNLLTPFELVNPRCTLDKQHKLEQRDTKHMFLDLGKLQPKLEAWVEKSSTEGSWTDNAINITKSWLKRGLEPRAITRDLKWGTPVPLDDPEFQRKVFYVWFDAPIGYISITANYTPEWRQWWCSPNKVKLQQFMGKDNVPFHAIVFPGSLLGTAKPWTMLHHLSTTEYLQYEGGKFSKSRNIGVFGDQAKETGIPSEVWRYYLLAVRPETSDSVFSWSDFADRNNNELLKNIGNFVNRALNLCYSTFDGKIPSGASDVSTFSPLELAKAEKDAANKTSTATTEDTSGTANTPAAEIERDLLFIAEVNVLLREYNELMEHASLRKALGKMMRISSAGNLYLQDTMPWVLKKTHPDRCASVIANAVALVRLLSGISEPFMPGFSDKVCHQLNLDHICIPEAFSPTSLVTPDHAIQKPQPLFSQIAAEQVEAFRVKFGGGTETQAQEAAQAVSETAKKLKSSKTQQKGHKVKKGASDRKDVPPFARVDIRVGQVVKAWKHEKAEKLLCEEIDIGEETPRLICSGLVGHYTAPQIQGRKVLVVANLKPRPLVGIPSHGMVLCAQNDDNTVVEIVEPPADSKPGERIYTSEIKAVDPDDEINPNKKNNPWATVASELCTNDDRQACFGNMPMQTSSGVCVAKTIANGLVR